MAETAPPRPYVSVYGPLVAAGALAWLAFAVLAAVGRDRPWTLQVYWAVAIVITLVGTHVRESKPVSALALATIMPAVLLAGFTTPRGDNDGLWMLIFLVLATLFGVCILAGKLYRRFCRPTVQRAMFRSSADDDTAAGLPQ